MEYKFIKDDAVKIIEELFKDKEHSVMFMHSLGAELGRCKVSFKEDRENLKRKYFIEIPVGNNYPDKLISISEKTFKYILGF